MRIRSTEIEPQTEMKKNDKSMTAHQLAGVIICASIAFIPNCAAAKREKSSVNKSGWSAEISALVSLTDKLIYTCAKPRDGFESWQEARERTFSSLVLPNISLTLNITMSDPENREGTPIIRKLGGTQHGGGSYDTEKKILKINYPSYIHGGKYFTSRRPFEYQNVLPEYSEYAIIPFAEEGIDLGSSSGTTRFGFSDTVESNRNVSWYLLLTDQSDVQRLASSWRRKDGIDAAPKITVEPNEGRMLIKNLVWEIKATARLIPGTRCVADRQHYISRRANIEQLWQEEADERYLPAKLNSMKLINKKTGEILYTLPE